MSCHISDLLHHVCMTHSKQDVEVLYVIKPDDISCETADHQVILLIDNDCRVVSTTDTTVNSMSISRTRFVVFLAAQADAVAGMAHNVLCHVHTSNLCIRQKKHHDV